MVSESNTVSCAKQGGCSLKGVDTRWCISKDGELQKEVDLMGVPHQFENEMSVREEAGREGEWIMRFHNPTLNQASCYNI